MSCDMRLEFETPCILLDRERLMANIERMARMAARAGIRLRPHVKTHKSVELAKLQLAGGAHGLTASKVDEAIVFIKAGAPSLTVAYPLLDSRKLDRLLAAARSFGTDLRVIVANEPGIEAAASAAERHRMRLGVFVKVDVGLGRVGVAPGGDEALTLARATGARPKLDFRGLLSHAGHAYAAPDRNAIGAIAERERRILLDLAARLRQAGLDVSEISVGSTPTVLGAVSFDGLTEIRPGNYVFLDGTALKLGIATREQIALTVLTTVLSLNEKFAICDAGSKTLSSDKGAHGTDADGYGRAYPIELEGDGWPIVRLSEEHGWIEHGGKSLRVGDQLRIVPNHSCVVANLVGTVLVIGRDGRAEQLEMQARACLK